MQECWKLTAATLDSTILAIRSPIFDDGRAVDLMKEHSRVVLVRKSEILMHLTDI